jgi:hypothetical protein
MKSVLISMGGSTCDVGGRLALAHIAAYLVQGALWGRTQLISPAPGKRQAA